MIASRLRPLLPRKAVDILDRLKSKATVGSPVYFGGRRERVHLGVGVVVNDALFNAVSGEIHVGDYAFFGHGVAVLTGTHDITLEGHARQRAVPQEGRDVVIEEGAWIASRATVIGPVRVGAHAVVCAGAVVTEDVPERTIVGGVPARVIGPTNR